MTSGGDRTCRFWKVGEDKQLVFRGSSVSTSIEAVRLLNDDHFVSGDDHGNLSLWHLMRKKPVLTVNAVGRRSGAVGVVCGGGAAGVRWARWDELRVR